MDEIASVFRVVTKHVVVDIDIKKHDLANGTTTLRIEDEEHFIADKLQSVEIWGFGRDGTRRKQKI